MFILDEETRLGIKRMHPGAVKTMHGARYAVQILSQSTVSGGMSNYSTLQLLVCFSLTFYFAYVLF